MNWGSVWLFCPADRPDRYEKAAAAADVVILDLEDAVSPADKAGARESLKNSRLDPATTVVRINASGTQDYLADLDALAFTDYTHVMLPKCESAQHVMDLEGFEVVILIESPLGALRVAEAAAAPNAVGVMWGAEDLVAALGGNSSRFGDGSYRDVARQVRSMSLLAAKAYGKFALDSVYLDIKDLSGLAAESADAVAVGFDAKVAIHPSQVPVIRDAYTPTDAEKDWAIKVLAEADGQRGVFTFEGKMVDSPVLRHAERVLRR